MDTAPSIQIGLRRETVTDPGTCAAVFILTPARLFRNDKKHIAL
jgi:hypothetical protein